MRFYYVIISDKNNKTVAVFTNANADGTADMNGLQFEISANVTVGSLAEDSAQVTLFGIEPNALNYSNWADIKNLYTIRVYGGMLRGLPLAKPEQQGLLIQGALVQQFTNWIGTSLSLTFVIQASTGSIDNPAYTLRETWSKGQKLSDFLIQVLVCSKFGAENSPTFTKDNIYLSKDLIAIDTVTVNLSTLSNFIKTMNKITYNMVNSYQDPMTSILPYMGINYYSKNGSIFITDSPNGTVNNIVPVTPIKIEDMVGQSVRTGPYTIQLYLVLRGDLHVNDTISLPVAPIQTSQSQSTQYPVLNRNGSALKGNWRINNIQHSGNSRGPTALDWVTTVTCYALDAKYSTTIV